jgi:hypothetical protein
VRIIIQLMLIELAVVAMTIVAVAQDKSEASIRVKQARAAVAFADALWPKGSPENAAAVRFGLNAAQAAAPEPTPTIRGRNLRSTATPATTLLERDPQFRENADRLLQSKERIWGGQPAHAFPETVSVQGGGGLCTGTLIAPTAVLTAGHCHCDGVNQRVTFGDSSENPDLVVRVVRSTTLVQCPPNSGDISDAALKGRDVALLILEQPTHAVPAVLAESNMIDAATSVHAVGYGKTETGQIGLKMEVDVAVATAACRRMATTGQASDAEVYGCDPGAELVAGAPFLNQDSCNGDSGGPIYVQSASSTPQNPRWLLAGSTSRATRNSVRPCGDGGIYERVDGAILDWVQSQGVTPVVD